MDLDRELIRLGAEQRSCDADPVAEIELLDDGVGLFGEQIFFEVHLEAIGPVLQDGKSSLPETA